MTPEDLHLDQQIATAQEHLAEIQQQADYQSTVSSDLLSLALAEFSTAIEELSATAEMLRQQNEELQDTRQMLDLERQRYQDLFNFAPDAYLVTDERGIILETNYTAQTLLNVRKDYMVGKSLFVFVVPEDRSVINEQLQKLKKMRAEGWENFQIRNNLPQTGQPKNIYRKAKHLLQDREVSLQPREKEVLPAAVSLSAECEHQGLIRLYWLFRDLSDRKHAEQRIREQAALIDVTTDAIFVCDLENRFLFWSRGAENLYGWTTEEILGKIAQEVFQKESSSQLALALQATIEHGCWQGELEQIAKTGREITVASRWTLVQNLFGHPQSILVVNTDITEKKQLEQQFYRAQRLESVGTLASGIAHDLNNVFAPILMIAQLLPLKCKNVDAPTQELFQSLEYISQRGANLVKQILTFTRGTEGQKILVQPGYLLQELVKVIQQTFPKSIEIVQNISTNTLWMVQADPTQLEQVFMNLVINARDAMPNGGTLTVTAENRMIDETYARMRLDAHAGEYIVITVSDTGTGIPPEFLEYIYDPFFTTKEVGKGTGLGLSTVLGIVKNYSGFVEVSTQVGKGTTFQVFLPKAESTTTETIKKTQLPLGNGELILVVDDEAVLQLATQETLADYNYQTLAANDGIEALSVYIKHQQEISAVLLDMSMPKVDGLTAIRTLRTLNPKVKIIAFSGLSTNEQKAIASGADKFLSKPYTTRDLLTSLSELIRVKE